jgi:hypothetical protein
MGTETAVKYPSKEYKHPKCRLTGTDGNVFALAGRCSQALKAKGHDDMAKEMASRIFKSKSYDDALGIMAEYCDIS